MIPISKQNFFNAGWNFDNSYARLPGAFYARLNPVPVQNPKLIIFNEALAQFLGLDPDIEYAASRGKLNEIRTLADYTIRRHFPDLTENGNPYLALLRTVIERQAFLIAR